MCSIFGAYLWNCTDKSRINETLAQLWENSAERGRDGMGFIEVHHGESQQFVEYKITNLEDIEQIAPPYLLNDTEEYVMLGNYRAEPTTEFVHKKDKNDQQPYELGEWIIVHNGTIANDKELRSNVYPSKIDSAAIVEALQYASFIDVISRIKGSYAILAYNTRLHRLFFAANYRPLWVIDSDIGVFFASSEQALDCSCTNCVPQMVEPYSWGYVTSDGELFTHSLREDTVLQKALVVCSGGLDSVVAANHMIQQGYEIELIHFEYGSRAQTKERKAILDVAEYLKVPVHFFPMPIYRKEDSNLLNENAEIAGGEEGAEYAHEWVPARNLVMLSLATAFAEARGFNYIVLGNNMEEAGSYPDNEPEFIHKFNKLLPFAVGDGKQVQVLMPVGNLMKHEIVALGLQENAPLHLTWSCYRHNEKHCGKCGPCFMRKTAFKINKQPEVIEYEE